MAKKKKEEAFEFPISVLEQINECAGGGFALFVYDEHGIPQLYSTYDSIPLAIAMHAHIRDWGKAMDEIAKESAMADIFGPEPTPRKKK